MVMTETQANLELILSTITDGVVVVDQSGIVLYANQSAEHIFERGDLLGSELAIPLSPISSYHDINVIRPSGIGWAELRSSPIIWKGRAAYLIGVHDITQRKQMEIELRDSEARLLAAQHVAHIGSWEFNLVSNRLWWSEEIYHIFEIDPLSFGHTYEAFLSVVHPEDRDAVNIAYTKHLENRQPYGINHRILTPDGRIKIVHEECDSHIDPNGKLLRTFGTMQDITERIQKENEAVQMHEQLVQATKMESIGHLTAGVAHDFNNILGAMIGYTQLSQSMLAAGKLDSIGRYQEEVLKAGNRAKELILQMLTFSRVSSEAESSEAPVTMLSTIIEEVISLLHSSIPTTIDLNYQIETEDLKARIHPVHLHQILLNLGVNARDAMGEYGKIDISLSRRHYEKNLCSSCNLSFAGDYARIKVKDSGSGIPKHILSKIFDPFFTTKGVGKGTGMGLAVVHGLVHAQGGHIYVETSEENGTAFNILLPLATSAKNTEEIVEVSLTATIKGIRIMVVDDEPSISTMLHEYLSAFGANVVSFTDPILALESYTQHADSFDLVLTDETMPGMSGMLLAEKLLKLKPGLPIILCTGFSEHASPESAANIGVAGFFYKPLNMNKLMLEIHDLCAAVVK
jgi:two-component system, cell cycle sensor histidine kinase and response regulator CckA